MACPCKDDACVVPAPFDPVEIAPRLLAWYGREGRELPWRKTRDPYRVWLSEVMLQQTTVAAVIPYYQRFLEHFPTVGSLAAAALDDVITLWAGLGYYSRSRNLHQAARQVVLEHEGAFPADHGSLTALPGVGRSTAGAILSIAFDKPAPILDGNVRRVLVRLFAWMEDPRSSRAEKQLWAWAEALTSVESPHDYAQAIMDLGATVCTPREPKCDHCPLREVCKARGKGLTGILPVSRKKQKLPVRQQVALIISSLDGILLRQRPPEGFLGGLWEFPTVDLSSGLEPEQAAARLLSELLLHGKIAKVGDVRHAYSHFKLELTVFAVEATPASGAAEGSSYRWCRGVEFERLPLHGAHRKAYHQIVSES
ncbi:MAG: A/G-specific adenine glycosylase [Desulfuromonadales bacterium]|nr:A/G-specific adenine glycosylase [Desulfuromonadales bacterium]